MNTTEVTSDKTANANDIEVSDKYLEKIYEMLNVLGLDLITYYDEDSYDITNENSSIYRGTDIHILPVPRLFRTYCWRFVGDNIALGINLFSQDNTYMMNYTVYIWQCYDII